MTPGYSRLLIFEYILQDTNNALYPVLLDMNMLALLSGMERSKRQWQALLEEAGLEIVKFWTVKGGDEGLIEAMRKA